MPTTVFKGYSVPTTGTETDTWGDDINANSFGVIDRNVGGIVAKTLASSPVTLSSTEAQAAILRLTGTLSANVLVTSGCQGWTIVENLTSGAFAVTFTNGVGSPVTVIQGTRALVAADTTNGVRIAASNSVDNLATSGAVVHASSGVVTADPQPTNILFSKDNSSLVLQPGVQGDVTVPFNCTITGVTLLSDVTGSMVMDIWKDSFANYPPTVLDSITSATPPTLSSASKYNDTTLTGWTTSITSGDVLRFNLNSVSTITRYTIALTVRRY